MRSVLLKPFEKELIDSLESFQTELLLLKSEIEERLWQHQSLKNRIFLFLEDAQPLEEENKL